MDPLCRALLDGGAVDDGGLDLLQEHLAAHGGTADLALLELDLVDEDGLLGALEQSSGLPAARPADLATAEPAVAARLPLAASESFRLCPVRLQPDGVVALVTHRLPERWEQELHDLFSLAVTQLVAPAHYLAVARQAVYGVPLEERAQALEQRLARRRKGESAGAVVAAMARAPSLKAAAGLLLDHGRRLLDFCCLMRPSADAARPWLIGRGGAHPRGEASLPIGPGCVFAAAVLHSGYFLGPVGDSPAHHTFFAALERDVPRMAFVAPAPGTGSPALVLYGDNGPRGIAARWVAELSLLTARLGQWHPARAEPTPAATMEPACPEPYPAPSAAAEAPEVASGPSVEPPAAAQAGSAQLSAEDLAALGRLRGEAATVGLTASDFLEQLLAANRARRAPTADVALGGEVTDLLHKLASDIPTQLARGVEIAFREMLSRLGPTAMAASATGTPPSSATDARGSRPGGAEIVAVSAAAQPREVPDYRTQRRKIEATKF